MSTEPLVDADDPVLAGAFDAIHGREEDHGAPEDSFERIAGYWNEYLDNAGKLYKGVTPAEVSDLLILFKMARAQSGSFNVDDYRDMAGYASLSNQLRMNE